MVFTNRTKFYAGLIAAGLLVIPTVLFFMKEQAMNAFVSYLGVPRDVLSEIWLMFSNGADVSSVLLLFLPTLILLVSGIIETAVHLIKKKIGKPAAAPVCVSAEAAPPTHSNASELKQYKELLDMGAITQAEYDAKKKQLLGLPDMDPAPAAPQNIGKCVACGRENVPVETIEVVVAGMSRKRTLCADCAARYK